MKQAILAVFCLGVLGCAGVAVEKIVTALHDGAEVLDVIAVAVQLSSLDPAQNDEAYAALQDRYGIDLKPEVEALTDAGNALIETATRLRNEIKTGRGITPQEQAFLDALTAILPPDPEAVP